jgi:hypothetical protein
VYTSEQASAGSTLYSAKCMSCHSVAGLATPDFKRRYHGKPLWVLYNYIAKEMPADNPGTLPPAENLAALAHILQFMNMPAGSRALTADSASLSAIRIDTTTARAPLDR